MISNPFFDIQLWQGINVVKSNYLEPKIVKIPVRWRTIRERYFTLPWRPKELFEYDLMDVNAVIMFSNIMVCNPIAYHRLNSNVS